MGVVLPIRHQAPLPATLIRAETPHAEAIELEYRAMVLVAALAILGVALGLAGFPVDIKPITHELKGSPLFVSSMASISRLLTWVPAPWANAP